MPSSLILDEFPCIKCQSVEFLEFLFLFICMDFPWKERKPYFNRMKLKKSSFRISQNTFHPKKKRHRERGDD